MTTGQKLLKPLQSLKKCLKGSTSQAVDSQKNIGVIAEQAALNYLLDQGLKAVQSNYFSRFGEIDLIMTDAQAVVFIEVRYRKYSSFGSAAMTVTKSKQQKLINTAKHYLQEHQADVECRFDVTEMSPARLTSKQQQPSPFEIHWIKNAFM